MDHDFKGELSAFLQLLYLKYKPNKIIVDNMADVQVIVTGSSPLKIANIEVRNTEITTFEMKWNKNKKGNLPVTFSSAYSVKNSYTVAPDNYTDFLLA